MKVSPLPSPSPSFAAHPDMIPFMSDFWAPSGAKLAEDYTPALPFIQAFERPSTPCTIGQYVDYISFNSALDTAIDETISKVAEDMAFKMGQSLSAIVAATLIGGQDGKASVESESLSNTAAGQETQSSTT